MKRSTISINQIRQSAREISRTIHPQKVILFGSYANGTPGPNSDVDLLVILNKKQKSFGLYEKISQLLEPRSFPIDLLVHTPIEIQKRLKKGDTFIQEILDKGKVLYES